MSTVFDFEHAPGHLLRRAQQLAVAIFMEETAAFDMTPVQFAMLNALIATPDIDQRTLAARVAFDAATAGAVIARLEAKGLLVREPHPDDARRKLLRATRAGAQLAKRMHAAVSAAQVRMLAPLAASEQTQLLTLLHKLVAQHEATPN